MRASRLWILILILAAGLTACTPKEDDSSSGESRLNKATDLIDKGDYDQAISILEDLNRSETNDKVRQVLASAYAGRAGVKVENYWGFVVTYKPLLKGEIASSEDDVGAPLLDPKALPKSTPKEVRDMLRSVNENMREFMKIRRRVEQIPHAGRESRFDLQRGVDVLAEASSPGAHLYRAILEIILLRSAIDEAVGLASDLADDSAKNLCASKARAMVEWVRYSQGTLANALTDLGEAYPDDRENLMGIRKSVTSFEIPSTEQVCGSGF